MFVWRDDSVTTAVSPNRKSMDMRIYQPLFRARTREKEVSREITETTIDDVMYSWLVSQGLAKRYAASDPDEYYKRMTQ